MRHSSMGDERSHGRITQIGTEGGLLLAPVSIPAQGLALASAERADLLVDLSDLASGTASPSGTALPRPSTARWSTSRPPAASTSTACCPTRGAPNPRHRGTPLPIRCATDTRHQRPLVLSSVTDGWEDAVGESCGEGNRASDPALTRCSMQPRG